MASGIMMGGLRGDDLQPCDKLGLYDGARPIAATPMSVQKDEHCQCFFLSSKELVWVSDIPCVT